MAKLTRRQWKGILLAFLVMALSMSAEMRSFLTLPKEMKTTVGEEVKLDLRIPQKLLSVFTLQMTADSQTGPAHEEAFRPDQPLTMMEPGRKNLKVLLLGVIPLKSVQVTVVPQVKLIPGGHSIGVVLQSQGVLVVGHAAIVDGSGQKRYPAKDAGMEVGDVLLQVGNTPVKSDGEVARLIDEAGSDGRPIPIVFKRGEEVKTSTIQPVYCSDTKRYRVGLYVRDRAAGIGTLTFFDTRTKQFGALGHVINDADTNQRIDVAEGRIVPANVHGIQQGKKGSPGEKMGVFQERADGFNGSIEKNTYCGIFGTMKKEPTNPLYPQGLPIALSHQVQEGPAEILTVVNGETIRSFQIRIERVMPARNDGKSMVIRVTDPELLNLTGGIVQGMSGSPIIQNGHLIGAVTHVFVNEPTRGYGVLIEKMLDETGIPHQDQEAA